MIGFDEAAELTGQAARVLGVETLPLEAASGRTLASPVLAQRDAPATPVSTMDGYALAARDFMAGARLRLSGEAAPGRPFAGVVQPGACVRIFTGAAMPSGAEMVVIQERVSRDGEVVTLEPPLASERFVRESGSDFRMGETLVAPGQRLTPQALAAAAAADLAEVEVFRRPAVAILASGDELAVAGKARSRPHAIPDSASPAVGALAEAWGAQVAWRARLPDELHRLEEAAADALEAADLVVAIGGASVGERDFAKAMFAAHGLDLVFSKVAIKPGKPVWLGRAAERLVLGLPGNPGSALVTARLFLAPLLLGLGGRPWREAHAWSAASLAEPLPATGDRETFWRARAAPEGLRLVDNQDSGAQAALARADRLIRRRAGAPAAPAGEMVEILAL